MEVSPTQVQTYYRLTLGDRIKHQHGDEAQALCLWHDDRAASLSINMKSGLWHCHAGCGGGDTFEFEMKRTGCTFPEAKRAVLGEPERRIVKTYDYTDETGALLYQVVRFDPKGFSQRRPDGNGGWVENLDGTRRIPYRLPELIQAESVYITEGEKDADRIASLGLTASTNSGGGGKWRDEFSQHFAGKRVVILPDHDPLGRDHAAKVAHGLHGVAASVKVLSLPGLPDKGDVSDWLDAGHSKSELLALGEQAPAWTPSSDKSSEDKKPSATKNSERGQNQAGELITLVEECGAELFPDQYKEPWVCIPAGEHQDIVKVRGRFFRRWLAGQFWKGKGKVVPSEMIRAATNVLEAKAVFEGKQHSLHVRLAWDGNDLWYDLIPKAVRINGHGWEIVDRPPILFRRYAGQKPQLIPRRGGRIADVLRYINLPGEGVKGERLLFLVQLIAFAIPNIPRPISTATGTKGSAKTTLGRVIQELADPNEEGVLTFPDSPREFVQTMAHRHFAVFDNLSDLPKWGSDALCRAVTGAGFTKRELYSDDDDVLYSFRRGIALNSISGVARASDLLDRCIIYALPELETHEQETEFWATFEAQKPELLGGLFDVLSAAIRIKETMPRVKTTARMADFAAWGMAITQALGYRQEDFLKALADSSQVLEREAVQESPVGICLLRWLPDPKKEWKGTSTDLMAELKRVASTAGVDEKELPKSASWLSRRVKEISSDLRVYGWTVKIDHSGDRKISFAPFQNKENGVHGDHAVQHGTQSPGNPNINQVITQGYTKPPELDVKDAKDSIFPTPEHGGGAVPSVEEDL